MKPRQGKKRSFRNSGPRLTSASCARCGNSCEVPFVPRNDRPVYCRECFRADGTGRPKNPDAAESSRTVTRRPGQTRTGGPKDGPVSATCSECGSSFEMPFKPRFDRPVLCRDCFRRAKKRGSESSVPKRDRPAGKPKSLRRQEARYSGGSARFYASIREKLFEILGGKSCSACGFADERALGFSHVRDGSVFDDIRRGGVASSWGRYISDPGLARDELRVLCLNCNETREPAGRPEKPRKSRYIR